MKEKKILLISHDFPPFWWWQWIYVYEIVKRLWKSINVLTTFSKDRKDDLKKNIIEINYKWGNPIILIVKIYLYYITNLKIKNYKIIHWNSIDHFLFLLFKDKNKKYITTTHNTYLQRWKAKKNNLFLFLIYPFFIIIEYIVLKRSDRIICVSELTKENVEKMGIRKNIIVIENWVDKEKFTPIKKDKKEYNFLYIWRLEQRKRILKTLKIFKDFIKNYNWDKIIKFYIVWTWPDYIKIKNFINKNNLDKYIFLEWYQKNVKKYYDKCNCIILLSKWEGLPLVILEATSCGLSWIITKDASWKTNFIEKCDKFKIVSDNLDEKNIIKYMNYHIENKNNLICNIPDWNNVIKKIKNIYEE